VAYADDITLITDDIRKVEAVKQIFVSFEKVAGAKLNLQKTSAMKIGDCHSPEWVNNAEKVKILGITFEENLKTSAENNWSKIVNNIRHLLWLHSTCSKK
jgi:Reverse transcriptase (RNA-dependent DNA polymerase)